MASESESKSAPPPYVSYKTLKNFFRSLAQGVPPQIDKSIMRSFSGGVQTQVIQALKAMRLVDERGIAQPKMQHLVQADGGAYKTLLRDVLVDTYPFLRSGQFDPALATMKMLEDEMGKLAGGTTAAKCIAFFIPAAKDAGIPLSPYIEKAGKRAPSNGKVRKSRTAGENHRTRDEPHAPTHPQGVSWYELLLAKFPSFDPAWPDDVKGKWFDSFAKLREAGEKTK